MKENVARHDEQRSERDGTGLERCKVRGTGNRTKWRTFVAQFFGGGARRTKSIK